MTQQVIVTRPGVYDLAEEIYHGDPVPEGSLSCSGAKLLLPPNCPAKYDYARKYGRTPTRAMEFGTAAHREVLGTGWPVTVWPGTDWTHVVDGVNPGKWAKEQRAAGLVPITAADREKISAMRAAIEAHPTARLLLTGEVMAEKSLFWHDAEFGIWRRQRMDAIELGGRVYITDYKTARSADRDEFAKAAGNLGYHWQAAWYKEGVTRTLGDARPAFLHVVQEKDEPYLVAIYELDGDAIAAGRERIDRACRVYARCQEAGEWPGYQLDDVISETISLPRWAL